jgi:hypothetical protein
MGFNYIFNKNNNKYEKVNSKPIKAGQSYNVCIIYNKLKILFALFLISLIIMIIAFNYMNKKSKLKLIDHWV